MIDPEVMKQKPSGGAENVAFFSISKVNDISIQVTPQWQAVYLRMAVFQAQHSELVSYG